MGVKFWISFSGVLWFVIGVFLLLVGVKFVVYASVKGAPHSPLFALFKSKEQGALVFVACGLLLGFVKGRFVLRKTVSRVVKRIRSLKMPIRFFDVYSWSYFALIALMMLLGMTMRWLAIPSDIRGVIDIAVGSALMNGAMLYFRAAIEKVPVS
jgi:hypothetical protein